MNEDFKKRLFNLLGLIYEPENEMVEKVCCDLSILIKAMWHINRDKTEYSIQMLHDEIDVFSSEGLRTFAYKFHNNSELETLTKALEYILEQTK